MIRKKPETIKELDLSMDTSRAESLGAAAFAKGINAPCLDTDMMALFVGRPIGHPGSIPELKAWHEGWHKANAARASEFLTGAGHAEDDADGMPMGMA